MNGLKDTPAMSIHSHALTNFEQKLYVVKTFGWMTWDF
jgi:hypothetical protein